MVTYLGQSFNCTKFIFLTAPAFNDNSTEWKGTRINLNTKNYVVRCQEVGSRLGIPVIDLWTPMQGKETEMLYDGLHLTPTGNVLIPKIWQ
ncbi:hypothetical protein THRCLA_11021 [Thraustotheca clavata]|uniref:SGNH hydrolase-type esterase domain-containing protein n=1 Tax=Thraustotheca clavata TaxID=74557 RepID=A0A1V9Y9C2_9STRA|nr:hypothetical protein THRCLA_11021 [Thraustotheca clavata]